LRIDGKRAYEYARSGQELPQEIKPREVKVSNLELLEWYDSYSFPIPKEEASEDEKNVEKVFRKEKLVWKPKEEGDEVTTMGPACKLRMTVSGGFYVRSLCYDLGTAVESGAYMAELVRIKQGSFSIGDAVPWEDFVPGGPWEKKLVRILSKGKISIESTPVEDGKDQEEEKAKVETADGVQAEVK
jgi:tRNA pseudouridine55 synthase